MDTKDPSVDTTDQEIIEERSSKVGGAVVRKYNKGRFLGKGGFARCYQVENIETRKVSAIKIISKETLKKSKAKQKLVTEIKIHRSLEHKNILLFDHVFQDSENVYIILELCSNHTLNEMMKRRKRITEVEIQYYLYHLIQGLIYLHHQKVIHRDLKLGNIMLNENMEVKIGDFGLAAKLEYSGERRKTICGTPNYLAPEIVNNQGHSYQVDIWSLGVILYTLFFGRPPFETSDVKRTYKRIKECQYTFNEDHPASSNFKNLISRLLVLQPSKRLSLQQILNHPFMSSSKIPRQLNASVLTHIPDKSFLEQHGFTASSSKFFKTEGKQNQISRAKSAKGISERLLLRTTTGFNRNMFYGNKPTGGKDQIYQLKSAPGSNPNLMSNNYFKPESSKGNRPLLGGYTAVYVKKWVDYSSKYGLGYLLSDGSTGIYFNDATKMVLDQNGQKVDYVGNEVEGKRLTSFTVNTCPDQKQLSKKLTLMQYFKKYLQSGGSEGARQKHENIPFVYIKKWVKNQSGILFRLNNKVIQVNFNDKSQVMIYGERDLLLYSSPQGKDKVVLEMGSNQLRKNPEVSKRLEIVKEMVKKMSRNGNSIQGDALIVQPVKA